MSAFPSLIPWSHTKHLCLSLSPPRLLRQRLSLIWGFPIELGWQHLYVYWGSNSGSWACIASTLSLSHLPGPFISTFLILYGED